MIDLNQKQIYFTKYYKLEIDLGFHQMTNHKYDTLVPRISISAF